MPKQYVYLKKNKKINIFFFLTLKPVLILLATTIAPAPWATCKLAFGKQIAMNDAWRHWATAASSLPTRSRSSWEPLLNGTSKTFSLNLNQYSNYRLWFDSEMFSAVFIRFIAQVSLKAIRGEVVIKPSGPPLAAWASGERRNGGNLNEPSEFFIASQFRRTEYLVERSE